MPGAPDKMPDTMNVLLVEDQLGAERLVEQGLAGGGRVVTVDRVTSLSAAVDRLRCHTPGMVLLDLDLSDSRGLDTLVVLRAHAPRVPIVALTGPGPEEGPRALRSGAGAYLTKADLTADRLVAAVDAAMARQATFNDVLSPTDP